MQSHKVNILIATLITIGLHSSFALECTQTDGTSVQCATKCFIKTENNVVTKGCQEATATGCNSPTCFECATDNCNYLMCQTCTNCATLDTVVDANNKLCDKPKMGCSIQKDVNTSVVSRGCIEACAANDYNCNICSKDNCNIGNLPLSCIVCRSEYNAKCANGTAEPQKCVDQSVSNKCFEGKWGDSVIRGCLLDAGLQMQNDCNSATDKRCKICEGSVCNKTPSGGASTLKHMGLGMILGLIFILRQSA